MEQTGEEMAFRCIVQSIVTGRGEIEVTSACVKDEGLIRCLRHYALNIDREKCLVRCSVNSNFHTLVTMCRHDHICG